MSWEKVRIGSAPVAGRPVTADIQQGLLLRLEVTLGRLRSPACFSRRLLAPQTWGGLLGLLLALMVGGWLPWEATREPKNASPARDAVGLFARDKFVCIEVNLNQGISLLRICGQSREGPERATEYQDCLAPKILWLFWEGKFSRESFSKRLFIKTVLTQCYFSPSQDTVFPGRFHKYVKYVAKEKKTETLKYLSCI